MEVSNIYSITLRDCRVKSKTELRAIEHSYFLLKDKSTDYAKIIKAILELKKSVVEIYEKADDDIFADRKPF